MERASNWLFGKDKPANPAAQKPATTPAKPQDQPHRPIRAQTKYVSSTSRDHKYLWDMKYNTYNDPTGRSFVRSYDPTQPRQPHSAAANTRWKLPERSYVRSTREKLRGLRLDQENTFSNCKIINKKMDIIHI